MGVTLECEEIKKRFGGVWALKGVSLSLEAQRVTGLIGANGAGKTTLVDILSGFQRPTAGRIFLRGRDVTGKGAGTFVKLGIRRTFQSARPFPSLTVRENLGIGISEARLREELGRDYIRKALESGNLAENVPGDSLTAGQMRLLSVIRAAIAHPRVVLLDEPGAGMNATELLAITMLIRSLADEGTAVMLIDHNTDFLLSTSDHVVALDEGIVIAEGRPLEIVKDPAVTKAYLGVEGRTATWSRHFSSDSASGASSPSSPSGFLSSTRPPVSSTSPRAPLL